MWPQSLFLVNDEKEDVKTWCEMLQDPNKPGYLRNDNNDFLNYTDDWYILGFKPDAYAVIYYRGNNDAWQGYGGLTVYTRWGRVFLNLPHFEHWIDYCAKLWAWKQDGVFVCLQMGQ